MSEVARLRHVVTASARGMQDYRKGERMWELSEKLVDFKAAPVRELATA
jgi:hypothetical protein